MGVYSDYLERFSSGNFNDIAAERKLQLRQISQFRQRDVLVYAADINKGNAQISIDYSDLLPFSDQLSNLKGDKLDLVLRPLEALERWRKTSSRQCGIGLKMLP